MVDRIVGRGNRVDIVGRVIPPSNVVLSNKFVRFVHRYVPDVLMGLNHAPQGHSVCKLLSNIICGARFSRKPDRIGSWQIGWNASPLSKEAKATSRSIKGDSRIYTRKYRLTICGSAIDFTIVCIDWAWIWLVRRKDGVHLLHDLSASVKISGRV